MEATPDVLTQNAHRYGKSDRIVTSIRASAVTIGDTPNTAVADTRSSSDILNVVGGKEGHFTNRNGSIQVTNPGGFSNLADRDSKQFCRELTFRRDRLHTVVRLYEPNQFRAEMAYAVRRP